MTATCEANRTIRSQARPAFRLLVLLTVIAMVVAAGVWIVDPPRYRSKGYVRVDSPYPKKPFELRQEEISPDLMNRYVADQAVLVKDETVLRDALENSDLRSTIWFRSHDKYEILETLKDALSVVPHPGTSYFELSFATDSPDDSATIVNTILSKYVDRAKEMSQNEYNAELKDCRDREQKLTRDLEAILKAKRDFLEQKFPASGVIEGPDSLGEIQRTLNAEVTRLEQEVLKARLAQERFKSPASAEATLSPALRWAIQQDPEVANLRDLKLSLEIELESAATTQPESKAAGAAVRRKLKIVERKLSEMLVQKEREARDYQADLANSENLAAMQEQATLRERLLEIQAKQRDINSGLVTYRDLEEQQKAIQKELGRVRDYGNQLMLMLSERGIVRVTPFIAQKSQDRDIDSQLRTTFIALSIPFAYGLLLLCVRIIRGPRHKRSAVETRGGPYEAPDSRPELVVE